MTLLSLRLVALCLGWLALMWGCRWCGQNLQHHLTRMHSAWTAADSEQNDLSFDQKLVAGSRTAYQVEPVLTVLSIVIGVGLLGLLMARLAIRIGMVR